MRAIALLGCPVAMLCTLAIEVRGFRFLGSSPVQRYVGRPTTSTRKVQQHRWLGVPSSLLSSWKDQEKAPSPSSPRLMQPWWTSIFVASLVSAAMLGLPFTDTTAMALELSPGASTLETTLTKKQLIDQSTSTISRLILTLLKERDPLLQSVQNIQTVTVQELSSDTWRDVRSILVELQQELSAGTTINPPADWKRTLQDLKEGKINVIVNGEVVNVSLERVNHPKNTNNDDDNTATNEDLRFVLPDDEWVLRIQGYRGVDPNVVTTQVINPRKGPSLFRTLGWFDKWDTPYPSEYLPDGVSKTYGDIWVFQGVLAISFLYAWAYAYYGDQLDRQDKDAKAKKAAAASAATSPSPTARSKAKMPQQQNKTKEKPKKQKVVVKEPKETTPTVEKSEDGAAKEDTGAITGTDGSKNDVVVIDEEVDVNVVIGFDEEGKVVITTTEAKKKAREGVVPFVQALCFPWLGLLAPGMTAETDPPSADEGEESGEGLFSLVRALYFPWVGIFQGK